MHLHKYPSLWKLFLEYYLVKISISVARSGKQLFSPGLSVKPETTP